MENYDKAENLSEIDLSSIKKDHFRDDVVDDRLADRERTPIVQVKNHMKKFPRLRHVNNIFSCCRKGDKFVSDDSAGKFEKPANRTDHYDILKLFFPIWILLAIVPEEEDRTLTIDNITIAHLDDNEYIPDHMCCQITPGKGRLVINHLTFATSNHFVFNEDHLKSKLEEYRVCLTSQVREVKDNYAQLLNGLPNISCDSPHSMFGKPLGSKILYQPAEVYRRFKGDDILIAVLGYGYSQWPFDISDTTGKLEVVDERNFASETAPVCNGDIGYTLPWLIHDYTETSHFVICQTTYCDGTIANGATAKAINWLRGKWKNTWKVQPYNNLIILIPYGGQYMKDEMIEITEATAEGIIIVCAAGNCRRGEVVFPAALGTIISVGVAETGPRGREIDVSIDFSNQHGRWQDVHNDRVYLSSDCGHAAAIITGLLSLYLSRINTTFKAALNNELTDNKQEVVKAIKKQCPYYVHTCIIRELLVSKGNGSHDPQLGYGDGEKIIADLLKKEDILKDLADVILKEFYFEPHSQGSYYLPLTISDNERDVRLHGLTGDGVIIAVFDEKKPKDSPDPGHGEKCESIVRVICPFATVWTDFTSNKGSEMQRPFSNPLIQLTDVVSCSISVPSFDYHLCTAVNKAVMEGKIIVFAAGNYGQSRSNTVVYPGRIGNILVVGGRDAYYNRVGLSSVGREMDFLAEALQFKGGTSFAAPIVAGYVALLLEFIKKEMKDDTVSAWSKDPDTGDYRWRDITVFDAAHNVYAMRALLKLLVPKPQVHSETEGFGCLDVSVLLPAYKHECAMTISYVEDKAKEKIQKTLQKFYKCQL